MGREHSGREPTSARSPLVLRAVMSAAAVVLVVVAASLLAVAAGDETGDSRRGLRIAAGVTAAVGVVALVDLLVVLRRLRRGDHG